MSFSPIQNMWIEALRSGKYKQGRLFLRREGKYCCLGVAADLLGSKDLLRSDLTDEEMTQLGLFTPTGGQKDRLSLAGLNDIGHSFSDIAALLETGVYFEQDKSVETSQVP